MRARTPARTVAASSLRRTVNVTFARYDSSASSSTPSSSTSTWQPALPRGSMPAYDAALDYLAAHRDACVRKYEKLRDTPEPTPKQLADADNWEVDAYVNDPAVRAAFKETKGAGQMDRPVMRHLAEQSWKKRGGLDLIMGRVYQNKVVPDILPDIAPLNPFSLSIPAGTVEPGLTIDPSVLEQPPALYYQQFQHPSQPTKSDPNPSALFTLVALDPDEPDPENYGYSQRLHYMKTNIPLSVVSGQTSIITEAGGNELVSWEPFAPAEGSDRHRLIFILIRQLEGESIAEEEVVEGQETLEATPRLSTLQAALPRENFNMRSFMATFDLRLNSVVGINLVKGAWTEENREYTDRIYQQFRGANRAPVYRDVPHEERFATLPTPLQIRAEAIRQRAYERELEMFENAGLMQSADAVEGLEGSQDELNEAQDLNEVRDLDEGQGLDVAEEMNEIREMDELQTPGEQIHDTTPDGNGEPTQDLREAQAADEHMQDTKP